MEMYSVKIRANTLRWTGHAARMEWRGKVEKDLKSEVMGGRG